MQAASLDLMHYASRRQVDTPMRPAVDSAGTTARG